MTTKSENNVNRMTISLGTLGIEWVKPIFTVFVKENRFTKKNFDKNGKFTINIPYVEFNKRILIYCGIKSSNDVDISFYGANKDYHTVYYGEFVDTYTIK